MYDVGIASNGRSKPNFIEICQLVPNLKWGHALKHGGVIRLLSHLRKEGRKERKKKI
jgi:hypothetical protein